MMVVVPGDYDVVYSTDIDYDDAVTDWVEIVGTVWLINDALG